MMSQLSSRAGELKAQGAIEAAQDPNSKTSAQDAEDVIAAESKKAGIPALQFDPNASPEEKAAQARAVSSVLDPHGIRRSADIAFPSVYQKACIVTRNRKL